MINYGLKFGQNVSENMDENKCMKNIKMNAVVMSIVF